MPTPPRIPWTIPLAQGPVRPAIDRAFAAVFALAALAAIVVLARVAPDPRGFDTHTQLGLEPCGWPRAYGVPCPTCGCTTAACQVVHGHVFQAFAVQPFGAGIALLGLALGAHGLYCLLRGRSFVDLLVRVPFGLGVLAMVALFFGGWLYKYLVWPV